MPIEGEAESDWLKPWRHKRFYVMGLPVDPLTAGDIERLIFEAASSKRRAIIAHHNLHGLYVADKSPLMRALYTRPDSIAYIDGMPIVALARMRGQDVTRACRNTSVDFLPPMLRRFAAQGLKVAYVGSAPGREGENKTALTLMAPQLDCACFHGYFSGLEGKTEEARIISAINAYKPEIVFLGMGMPIQEEWAFRNHEIIDAPVIMSLGGFIDYFTGRTSKPPRLLGRLGLEWVWRLAQDPRRLGGRYLIEPLGLLRLKFSRTFERFGLRDKTGKLP